jgi:peptidoglycan/LPS O-acetylase OafA/YrhL
MWPVNPIDLEAAMMAAAERYAFYAALVSILLTVAAIGVFLFARQDLRSAALTATTLCVHPAWTVTETWYDDGATLRLASTIWIVLACLILAAALLSAYRHGVRRRSPGHLRFTSRSLGLLTGLAAIVFVLARPPLSDIFPVSRSLPAVGVLMMLIIAVHAPQHRRHRTLPTRITMPLKFDADGDEADS